MSEYKDGCYKCESTRFVRNFSHWSGVEFPLCKSCGCVAYELFRKSVDYLHVESKVETVLYFLKVGVDPGDTYISRFPAWLETIESKKQEKATAVLKWLEQDEQEEAQEVVLSPMRDLMEVRALDDEDIADKIGYHVNAVSGIVRGDMTYRIDELFVVAEAICGPDDSEIALMKEQIEYTFVQR